MINLTKKVSIYSKKEYFNFFQNFIKEKMILDDKKYKIGNTIEIILKDNEKIQNYKGIIIAKKGTNLNKTITIRFISHNIGINYTFFVNSLNILSLKVLKTKKMKRSKLYYIQNLTEKELTKIFL